MSRSAALKAEFAEETRQVSDSPEVNEAIDRLARLRERDAARFKR